MNAGRFLHALVAATVTIAACKGSDAEPHDEGEGLHGSEARLAAVVTTPDPAHPSREPTRKVLQAGDTSRLPGMLATVESELVDGFTGPGGRPFEVTRRTADPATANARPFGTITLLNSMRARSGAVGQYPCTSCHMGRRMVLADERIADAHREIRPVHPARTGAVCSTCHSADDVERLTLRSGERATLDHTYKLCAQCHFTQADAWAGGAHGKRVDGWQGKRVVMGCADCHDPHRPAIDKRIPFRAPQLTRIGSGR